LRIFEELADVCNQLEEKEGSQEQGEHKLLKSQQLPTANYWIFTLQQRLLLGVKR
jgi:hypothetical protein